ncbi:uncharacterized protein LOC131688111 [Topomyia yanbarensis]|uniref:uncharacterized protein LOC131688111 n=1 Tax=Topomyia yanbarensis TaxID=2498891 RepID=UPI00273C17B2|nr:uncharacterized protein LOC131688111 [Topomyia yanbarensis]
MKNMLSSLTTFVTFLSLTLCQPDDFHDAAPTASKEACFEHTEFPNPNECCTRPIWVNRYMLRACRFTTSETDNYRKEFGSCSASCGLYKINVTLVDNQVNRVRLFKPANIETADTDWLEKITSSLRLCKSKITSVIGRHVSENMEMKMCEHAKDVFDDCLNSQLFLHCPIRSWIHNEGCDMAKSHLMEDCPYKSLGAVVASENRSDHDLEELEFAEDSALEGE